MSKVFVSEASLRGIAEAIRGKLASEETFKPGEMAGAIERITGGGGLTGAGIFAENGVWLAEAEGLDGYSRVVVQVPPAVKSGLMYVFGGWLGDAGVALEEGQSSDEGQSSGDALTCLGLTGGCGRQKAAVGGMVAFAGRLIRASVGPEGCAGLALAEN